MRSWHGTSWLVGERRGRRSGSADVRRRLALCTARRRLALCTARRRLALCTAAVVLAAGCGASSPTAPSSAGAPAQAPATASLSGRVMTGDPAAAVPDARVEIVAGSDKGRAATTDQNGGYLFADLTPGPVTLRATAAGYAHREMQTTVEGDAKLDFALDRESTEDPSNPPSGPAPAPQPAPGPVLVAVTGTVRDATTGAAVPGASVHVVEGPGAGRSATAGVDGRFSIEGLDAGPAEFTADAAGFVKATRSVTLASDEVLDFELTPSPYATSGHVVDALTGSGLRDVRISGAGLTTATSDAAGAFRVALTSASGTPVTELLTFAGAAVVERQTHVRVPGDPVRVSLIPAEFDLAAFDEMFRDPELRRWTEAPALLVERRTLQFTSEAMTEGTALAASMSDLEVGSLVTDLTWALPQLTGDTFARFADVQLHAAPEGERVQLLNDGFITVVRVSGLADATGYLGYARWQYDDSGTVTGGLMLLDAAFDAGTSPYRRALRAHELGHALGYQHVTARPSVMNVSARLEPTEFDLAACRIAFARAPGNRAPDVDPDEVAVNRRGVRRWSRGIR